MEQHLGRKLLKIEHIHHINYLKTDNRIENLMIVSPGEHKKFHIDFMNKFQEKIQRNENLIKDQKAGMSYSQLVRKYKISLSRVQQIVSRAKQREVLKKDK